MSKEKFVYNKQTLKYEKVERTWKEISIIAFGLCSAFFVAFLFLFPLFQRLFPQNEQKDAEIEQLKVYNEALRKQVEMDEKALVAIQNRDRAIYRTMFNMDPIDPSVWQGGTGGHDRLARYANFGSAKVLAETQEILDKLTHQIALQSKSLDTIAKLAREKEAMIQSIPSIKPVREDKLSSSLGYLSGFGWRIHPIHRVRKFHKGIDFSAPHGTAIQATGDGVVVQAGRDGGYGNCVIISHGYGYQTLYGHMSKVDVSVGDRVKKGQRIGLIGSTGASTGPHCHYEVHVNGVVVNPVQFCLDGLTPAEYQALVNAADSENRSVD